jgi:hypothetical protein
MEKVNAPENPRFLEALFSIDYLFVFLMITFSSRKIRRLYDVANVLCAIHLIRKVKIPPARKPFFRFMG